MESMPTKQEIEAPVPRRAAVGSYSCPDHSSSADFVHIASYLPVRVHTPLGFGDVEPRAITKMPENVEDDENYFGMVVAGDNGFVLEDVPHLTGDNLSQTAMAGSAGEDKRKKWRKVAYGGMQPGYDDNYTDDTFLEDMVMNANVVKRDVLKVMVDSVSISQYLSIVAIVGCVWTHTLRSKIDESSLLALDLVILALGLLTLQLSCSIGLLLRYLPNVSLFVGGLYVLAPIYQTLTRSISSDSIWALTASLLTLHVFLHDYSGTLSSSNISLNSSIVASVLIASRVPSRPHVFAIMLFSLEIFLFAPLVTHSVKKYSMKAHICVSFALATTALAMVFRLHGLLFALFACVLVFVSVACPFWLVRLQEYKFEINGPWDEAKLCFDITE